MRTGNIKIQCWLSEKEYKAFDRAVMKTPKLEELKIDDGSE